jgi:hypothetical protein
MDEQQGLETTIESIQQVLTRKLGEKPVREHRQGRMGITFMVRLDPTTMLTIGDDVLAEITSNGGHLDFATAQRFLERDNVLRDLVRGVSREIIAGGKNL